MQDVIAKRIETEKQERIEQILKAARTLFVQKGYLGATMRDIALEAELSTGAIYVYFSGKDEIYAKVCEEAFLVVIGLIKKAAETPGTPKDRLRAICREYYSFYTDYTEYFEMLTFHDLGFTRRGQSEELSDRLKELTAQAISIIHDVVAEAIESGEFSDTFDSLKASFNLWAGLEGILLLDMMGYLRARGFEFDLDELVLNQLEILLLGISVFEDKK
ncbi:MAG: TetR/AcrR family transcriptional regulator [Deltaproteobacteria bacterium]|nr:TetR/AcrR family transcriptional regulator [Candidatus Zymogenaceae bacterium]